LGEGLVKKISDKEINGMIENSDMRVMILFMEYVNILVKKGFWVAEAQQKCLRVYYNLRWKHSKQHYGGYVKLSIEFLSRWLISFEQLTFDKFIKNDV